MFDLAITGGLVVDGSGRDPAPLDVALRADEIVEVGHVPPERARRRIDASGLAVAPGFIDIHSHSDLVLASGQRQCDLLAGRIRQGITTEVIGNCGIGVAPRNAESEELLQKLDAWMSPEGLDWRWQSFPEYLSHLEEAGVAVNVAPLLAHGPVRLGVMGLDRRPPRPSETEAMQHLVRQAMEAGAFGLSCGLVYPPGMYASTEELVDLCRMIQPFEGLFASHIRGSSALLLHAVREIIEIGERAGVAVQHSHSEAFGARHFPKIEEMLRLEAEARERGVDVAFDVFPYTAAATNMLANYPPWALDGGPQELARRLMDPQAREAVRRAVETPESAWPPWTGTGWAHNLVAATGWDNIVISNLYLEKNRHLIGMSLSALARAAGKSPFDILSDLMVEEEGLVSQLIFGSSGDREHEEWLQVLLQNPWGAISTDAVDVQKGVPHPAAYGTYPRVLGRYVREMGLLSLSEAVRKMTSLPASRLGLRDRGCLAKGMKADVVVFDPGTVRDNATYERPRQTSEGIRHVLVNGRVVVEDGVYEGCLAGRVLRKGH